MKNTIHLRKSSRQTKQNKKRSFISKAVIASILAAFFLTGCGNDVANSQNIPANSENLSQSKGQADKESNPSYQITTAEFNQDNIKIQYPQIKGLDNETKEKAVNELIKNDIWNSQVEEVVAFYQEDGSTIQLNIDLNYQVSMSTDDILSIMYTGNAYIEGGMHPDNVFHGITIDLKSSKRLALSAFIEIDEGLIRKIRESEEIRKQTDEILSQDDQEMIWVLKNDRQNNFCVKQNALVVSVMVCHAAGDYVLAEIPGQYKPDQNHTYDDSLCLDSENLLLSFQTEKSGKTVSICTSKDNQTVVYRFGTKAHIEFEYPDPKQDAKGKFTYSCTVHGVDGGSSGNDSDALTFENKGYRYRVYQQYDNVENRTKVGVMVTDLTSGKETDIIGDADTLIGYWYGLRENKYRNIVVQ